MKIHLLENTKIYFIEKIKKHKRQKKIKKKKKSSQGLRDLVSNLVNKN